MTTKFQREARKILQTHGLQPTVELIDSLELLAADIYAHGTVDGWCCACDADIAFAESWLRETKPELFKQGQLTKGGE